jgi:heme exporter protein C
MTAPPAPPGTAARSGSPPATTAPVIDWFLGVAVLGIVGVYIRAIYFTPGEASQGLIQKILYVHPPSAMAAYLAFGVMALMSVLYLWIRDDRADQMAEAGGEVALVFFTVVIITGPIWAHPIWNAWWVWWDARLVSSLFLWFIGIGYMVVRSTFHDVSMRARYSAVLGIMAALLIPFIHLSVYIFDKHMHPDPIFLRPPDASNLTGAPPEMTHSFWLAVCGFCFLSIALMRARYRLGMQRLGVEALEDGA